MSALAVAVTTTALAVAAVLSIARLLRRGTVADRTLGLDMLVVVLAAAVVIGAAADGDRTAFLTVVTVVALLAFVATVTIARFLEPTDRSRNDTPATRIDRAAAADDTPGADR